MFRHLLKRFTFPGRTSRRPKPAPCRCRPSVEVLENRDLPSGNAPVAADDSLSVLHDRQLIAYPLANDYDPENDPLVPSIVDPASHGFASFNLDGSFSYWPDTGWVGTDTVTYLVNDGTSDSNVATITIAATNQIPTIFDTNVYSLHHSSILMGIDLLANTDDWDGDPLTVEIVQQPAHGWVQQNDTTGLFDYYPEGGYAGPDSFTFRVFDGVAYSNTATVSLNLTNTPPVANYLGAYTVVEGDALPGLDLLANASDVNGDPVTAEIVQQPSHGYVSEDYYTGTYTFVADGGYCGPITFTYRAHDGVAYSNVATVTIYVLGGEGYEAYNRLAAQ